MVARDHLHPDSRALAGGHGPDRLGAGGIEHALQTQKIQPPLDLAGLQLVGIPIGPPDGEGQHPLAPAGHGCHRGGDALAFQGLGLAARVQLAAAAGQHHLHRALDQDAVAAVQGGHVLLF